MGYHITREGRLTLSLFCATSTMFPMKRGRFEGSINHSDYSVRSLLSKPDHQRDSSLPVLSVLPWIHDPSIYKSKT